MVEIGKYKVSNLAKDLKLKNKDVTDLLEKNGFPGRTHSSVLSADEYSFLMNYYMTQNQIVDINSYMDKKTQIVDSSIVKLVQVPEAPKATAKPAPKAEQVKAEQPKAEPSKAEKPTAKETPKTAQETKKA
ncbi:MAG: translation initiation factor IF-2 N-terminal domain-containing protein, partial [Clostridia bacterium]|nr:translation initiation factor IF-2 N-terminal domain-containing protein [Clostridia bacterium]